MLSEPLFDLTNSTTTCKQVKCTEDSYKTVLKVQQQKPPTLQKDFTRTQCVLYIVILSYRLALNTDCAIAYLALLCEVTLYMHRIQRGFAGGCLRPCWGICLHNATFDDQSGCIMFDQF